MFGNVISDSAWDKLGSVGERWELVKSSDDDLLFGSLCGVGETVQVIPICWNVIALSKNWKGVVSDHSDKEIWLKEEKTFLRRHVRYCCEVYSFGTLYVPGGGIEEEMGERPGTSRVSHQFGRTASSDPTVTLNSGEKSIGIADACFRIVG